MSHHIALFPVHVIATPVTFHILVYQSDLLGISVRGLLKFSLELSRTFL